LGAQHRELVRLDTMLAGEAAYVEQACLGLVEPGRIEGHGLRGAENSVFSIARLDQRAVEGREGFGEQGMIRGAAFDPTSGLPELRQRTVGSAE
jgi:hypothetical protein